MPLLVEIVTQEGKLFEEPEATMVIIPGEEGEMGVLPHHAALLTTLRPGELRVRRGNAEESFIVYGGVVEVRPDRVIVLADMVESSYDVDTAKAAEARQQAEQSMRQGLPPDQLESTIRELRRAQIQENVLRRVRSRTGTLRIRTIEDGDEDKKD